jgi:sec-independent protein translocase protein TatA
MTLAVIAGWDWIIIGGLVLLLFGGRKLPALARSMGASVNEFKRGLKDGSEPSSDDAHAAPVDGEKK